MGSLDVSAAAVSCEDTFDWFCETVSSDVMPVSLSTRHTADFRADITDLDLGAARLSTFACSPVLARRTPLTCAQAIPSSTRSRWPHEEPSGSLSEATVL